MGRVDNRVYLTGQALYVFTGTYDFEETEGLTGNMENFFDRLGELFKGLFSEAAGGLSPRGQERASGAQDGPCP